MDAPPTQYRVIEKGGKLIVLDARTNLPPKQAADLHRGRETDRLAERVSARELFQGNAASKRKAERTGRNSSAMQAPVVQAKDRQPAKKAGKLPGVFILLIALAVFAGGLIGLAIAAAAVIYVGYSALKTNAPKS